MEPTLEGNPLDSEPEAGTSNILKSLWFPPSTISTRKSGQIVYGCAFLLGEQLDLTLVVFWNWQDRLGTYILSVEESWRHDGFSWGGQFWEGYDPTSWSIWLLELKLFSSTLTPAVLLIIILSLHVIVAMLSDGASHSSLLFFKIVVPVHGRLLSRTDFRVSFLFPLIFLPWWDLN